MAAMRILAIDDDPIILDLLSEYLPAEDGYDLVLRPCAESGLEALSASDRPFDCIILDIMLPGMNGIEMCARMRKSKRNDTTPILMITGSKEVDLMARAFKAGATDFITKPLDCVELAARIISAGLLNQSLAKAQHTMSELTQLVKIPFHEPIALKVDGISEALALENELLRRDAGCFAMTVFSLKVCGLRGIYRSVSAPAYRRCLEVIGAATLGSMKGHKAKLTYVGNGRFIGAVMERARLDRDVMTENFNADLAKSWDIKSTDVPVPPTVRITAISSQRIWSGKSASDALRGHLMEAEVSNQLALCDENDLFSRLELKLGQFN